MDTILALGLALVRRIRLYLGPMEWHSCDLRGPVLDFYGRPITDSWAWRRRRPDMSFEYRKMTETEIDEKMDSWAHGAR